MIHADNVLVATAASERHCRKVQSGNHVVVLDVPFFSVGIVHVVLLLNLEVLGLSLQTRRISSL